MGHRLAACGAIATAVVIAFASAVFNPLALLPWGGLPHIDKVGHVMAYVVLAVCLSAAAMPGARYSFSGTVLLLMVPIGLGLTCEWAQDYIPGRSADPWDMAANGVGMVIGVTARRGLAHAIASRCRSTP